jgi:uncharacterized protein (TIGR03437 family)
VDGVNPTGIMQATSGKFYGTTTAGGVNSGTAKVCAEVSCGGTVFQLTPSGTLTTLYSFCSQGEYTGCTDGQGPAAPLVQGRDGNLYGTTTIGGTNVGDGCDQLYAEGCGTVFKITPSGTLTTLYNFCVQQPYCTDGIIPVAGLVQATDGNFYGTTSQGGTNTGCSSFGCGTVFKITPGGTLTTIYNFCAQLLCADGSGPVTALVQGTDGNLYGTTPYGGANGHGTVFKITTSGMLTTRYSFCPQSGCADGAKPLAGLVQATDGNLYGTTVLGGASAFYGSYSPDDGTIFKITTGGALTTLYSFCSRGQIPCTDGVHPEAGLVQATNGYFYGTTFEGGTAICGESDGCGTLFSLSLGLTPPGPAVNAGGVLNSASYTAAGVAPGSIVSIFGTDLAASTAAASAIPLPTGMSDVTSVTFNGIPAGLYFVSQNQINAQIPFNLLPGQSSGTASIVVTRTSGESAPQNVTVVPVSPGIFTTTANGIGQAFAYDNTSGALAAPADVPIGSFATTPISVTSGHALIIACTGLGSVTPSIDNLVAASDGIFRYTVLTPTVLIGGVAATPVYSVLSPQFVSEYQVGVVPGSGTPRGNAVPIQIEIGGVTTTSKVTIAVAP